MSQMVRDTLLVDYISMASADEHAKVVPQLHQLWDSYSASIMKQGTLKTLRDEVAAVLDPEVITPVWPAPQHHVNGRHVT